MTILLKRTYKEGGVTTARFWGKDIDEVIMDYRNFLIKTRLLNSATPLVSSSIITRGGKIIGLKYEYDERAKGENRK